MRVEVTRSGGFAGISRGWQADVDEQPDKDEWLILIDDLPWDDVPAQPSEPDRYTWIIRIAPRAEADDSGHEAALPERALTGGWKELVDRVKDCGTPVRPSR
ncbi:protealysin inhibitor emfourin [Labedella endophytica]|uniref:Uncharacterized protein n=1 Tax=Labedella endophytica TaxID=1523160 RepID=A0A3S0VGC0_9MICO|nr:protealysin inhibitor emfourin [Labedella endophytica]RUR01098.1 hypothetical protein ELQ94_06105 [Labedella endophytica]